MKYIWLLNLLATELPKYKFFKSVYKTLTVDYMPMCAQTFLNSPELFIEVLRTFSSYDFAIKPFCKKLLIFLKVLLAERRAASVCAGRPDMCYPLSLLATAGSGGDLRWSPGNVLWEEVKHLTYPAPEDNRLQSSSDKARVFWASSALHSAGDGIIIYPQT